jgi:hypothetical protein
MFVSRAKGANGGFGWFSFLFDEIGGSSTAFSGYYDPSV